MTLPPWTRFALAGGAGLVLFGVGLLGLAAACRAKRARAWAAADLLED